MGRRRNSTRWPKKVGTWLGQATEQRRQLLPRVGREPGPRVSLSSLQRLAYG
ncbi:hypothetical protein IC235_20730 [Hymenobacter sp. BT664]|uniref:Uncharacterized protein n=1 Tax=Hymenobacter montanus TaxID=2771359 RepID=A0A927GLA5_9BACT|nr:hypothetical protein [Hymenobacter montanus]MBD2770320.1 hypothetical protein [Hymenobacter montanus]